MFKLFLMLFSRPILLRLCYACKGCSFFHKYMLLKSVLAYGHTKKRFFNDWMITLFFVCILIVLFLTFIVYLFLFAFFNNLFFMFIG